MMRLAYVALLVHDYDEAIAWFTRALGWVLLEDTPREAGKRWVRVAPSRDAANGLLLARAANEQQSAQVGRFAGGRVGLFVHTDDFDSDHARMLANGVHFVESPRSEEYGKVAVFEDLYGNRWDLIGHGQS
jgi:catechol 2,3-dioxygenase-like lactoylglutathione lyase family enzyme